MANIKNFFYIVISFFIAFSITEVIVQKLIGYPTYGVSKFVEGIRTPTQKHKLYLPYSKYWNSEDGINVFNKNNVGLSGTDIVLDKNFEYVFVVGDSFIEAEQLQPSMIATSLLQDTLRKSGSTTQVVNLGTSGFDPYNLFFKLKYFSNYFKPKKVILVIERTFSNRLIQYGQELDFKLKNNFGKENTGFALNTMISIRNSSSILNLFFGDLINFIDDSFMQNTIISDKNKNIKMNNTFDDDDLFDNENKNFPKQLFDCLKAYKNEYQDKFILVSIIESNKLNFDLNDFCYKNSIKFAQNNINTSRNRIKGFGHLNNKGNRELSNFLYEVYNKY